ncbi:MAG: glycosyltransferase family 2 protein [Nonlabens sp.]
MRVGVIILNWNGRDLLERFLPSVVKYSGDHDIYLADNNSTDDSVSYVEKSFPKVQIIKMKENRGYAGGYNEAIHRVSNELLCLVNSDVAVTEGWCDTISTFFSNDLSVGAAQPKILDYTYPNRFEYAGAAGGFLDRLAYPFCRGRIFNTLESDSGQYNSSIEVDWASGACLFIRKSVFLKAGSFDPDYFAHQEEIDLCWRIRKLGYKISIDATIRVYHMGGGTLSSLNPQKTFYNFRNSLFNIVKNDSSQEWWIILLLRMVLDGIAALKFVLEGKVSHFKAVLKAHISFYKNLKSMWRKRILQKNRDLVNSKKSKVLFVVWQYFVKRKRYFHEL